MQLYGRNMVFAISLVAGLGIVFEGYDQGVMSGVNISPSYIDLMQIGDGATGTITNASKQGGLVAIYYLGTLVGALLGGWLSDKIGRNKAIEFGCVWGILGSALQVAAQNSNWMLCARIIAGVGTGIISAVIPVWGSELVNHDNRGMVMAFEMVVNYAGISSAYWLEYLLALINNGNTTFRWRFPLGFQMIFLIMLMVIMVFMPESPRFDIANGKKERGRKTLAILRARGDINHPDVVAEYDEIIAAVELEAEFPTRTFYHMITGSKSGELHLGRRTFLAAWLQIMQAWTGVTTVVVYAPTLFKIAGFDAHKASLLTGCCNLVAMCSCVLAIFTIDHFGRRKVLIEGGWIRPGRRDVPPRRAVHRRRAAELRLHRRRSRLVRLRLQLRLRLDVALRAVGLPHRDLPPCHPRQGQRVRHRGVVARLRLCEFGGAEHVPIVGTVDLLYSCGV